MIKQQANAHTSSVETLEELARLADYSFVDSLNRDPESTADGNDHAPRQVFSGHYVPVKPTPISSPEYVSHSRALFRELGFADSLAHTEGFTRVFSGDLESVPAPMRSVGWACGYALSIFGTEYTRQCPFQTGNGYGDGRAISVLEAVIQGRRWEMQLKGAGRTPYCRGADGRAVLRSSVREFLAQEHMHALGVPTSRSLSLYVSRTEEVDRPWYSNGSTSMDPDRFVSEPVAITTRVAPSFIRVGQLELFSRRARAGAPPKAMEELRKIVFHVIDREYSEYIDQRLNTADKVVALAREFADRLSSLVADWVRVGYCQGNFNSDNCAVGGFTLDYGPFGFCDAFDPYYQPWTGGGRHFSFLAQPIAAERNFQTFCSALRPLLQTNQAHLAALEEIQHDFANLMQSKMEAMWAAKLGLDAFDPDLFNELLQLMMQTGVDYTIFFRELSHIPADIGPLRKSFYGTLGHSQTDPETTMPASDSRWSEWLNKWRSRIGVGNTHQEPFAGHRSQKDISTRMKRVNPKYILREWLVVPAYQQAAAGDYSLVREIQAVMTQPYAEQSKDIEQKYYRLKPPAYFHLGGVSHYSCSS